MKKTLALLLALAMVTCLFAGCNNTEDPEKTDPTGNNSTDPVLHLDKVNTGYNTVIGGSVTTGPAAIGGGNVGYDVYAGTTGKDYTDPNYYTYNDFMAATSNMKWSTHTWETNDDSAILDYITSGFYTFVLNSTATGWSVACEMAAELPQDVTADYVGSFGVKEGDSAKAWKIVLNPNATWEDGTPINADTYIYSYKELLDPLMKNRRADSLYAGDFVIFGAQDYFYQGQTSYSIVNSADGDKMMYAMADLVAGADGVYVNADGQVAAFGLNEGYAWMGGNSLADYYGAGYIPDEGCWAILSAAADEDGYVPVTDETIAALLTFTSSDTWGNETKAELGYYITFAKTYGDYSWEDVGILKTGDYELVMITTAPTENPNYYVPYNLSGTYLVYQPLWESCKSYFDADGNKVDANADNIASITTNYCTSKDTTMSYGPYKLSYFELDKQYNLTRNEAWYGYSDNNHLGQYQTDEIKVVVIADHDAAVMAFGKGEIDGVGLDADDMEIYGTSDWLLYTPESYTTKLTFNTNLDSLMSHETGSQVLYSAAFRQAFSLAIDRATFCSSFTAGHLPGYGLLNTMYVYDPFTGACYRDTDGAMKAIVDLYGLTYGEDGDYDTLQDAYDAVTGYDMVTAKALMQTAYDECVASGLYDGTSEITLDMRVYQSTESYVKMFNFLNEALKAACVGTGFEGKVSLKMTADADYYETMYSGGTDIIFSTWGGAAYSPYTMLDQCYCDASDGSGNQMEYGFDTDKLNVTITIDGHEFTESLKNWAAWAGNRPVTITSTDGELTLGTFASYDYATRSQLFAIMENAYLGFFATTPIYYRNSVSVYSQKLIYPVDAYVDLIGYGGIQFLTYQYNDTEWANVAGSLTY